MKHGVYLVLGGKESESSYLHPRFDTHRHHSPSVSCESSYLPFMFSSDHETNASSSEDESTQVSMSVKPSGRRTFDDGREVIVSYFFEKSCSSNRYCRLYIYAPRRPQLPWMREKHLLKYPYLPNPYHPNKDQNSLPLQVAKDLVLEDLVSSPQEKVKETYARTFYFKRILAQGSPRTLTTWRKVPQSFR